MPDIQLSPEAQHWLNAVLIWIGFGALAGLAARAILPVRWPSTAAPTLIVGIAGSALGLGVLSASVGREGLNPISPLGLIAATGGALVLLAACSAIHARWPRHEDEPSE